MAQIRLALETFRGRLSTEIFPGRTEVPKTLIFCKDDNHAEQVVTLTREVFGRGNEFAVKITYSAKKPRELIKTFRTSPNMRIAVTVLVAGLVVLAVPSWRRTCPAPRRHPAPAVVPRGHRRRHGRFSRGCARWRVRW